MVSFQEFCLNQHYYIVYILKIVKVYTFNSHNVLYLSLVFWNVRSVWCVAIGSPSGYCPFDHRLWMVEFELCMYACCINDNSRIGMWKLMSASDKFRRISEGPVEPRYHHAIVVI